MTEPESRFLKICVSVTSCVVSSTTFADCAISIASSFRAACSSVKSFPPGDGVGGLRFYLQTGNCGVVSTEGS